MQYPGLDETRMGDHFTLANNNYYDALRNQFSLINTQISKVLYLLVFHSSWVYFVYVYIRQIFSAEATKVQGATDSVLTAFFDTNNRDENGELDFRHEQFISFLMVTFLIIENKIIEMVGERFGKIEEQNPEKVDTEKCAANLLAHLDLYIAKRNILDQPDNLSNTQNNNHSGHNTKVPGAPSELSISQLPVTQPENNSPDGQINNSNLTQPTPSSSDQPKDEKKDSSEPSIDARIETLKNTIDASYENEVFAAMLLTEAQDRIESEAALRRINDREGSEVISEDFDVKLYLNERTNYHDKLIFFNIIKNKFSMAQLALAFMKQMQRLSLVFIIINVSFSPAIPNVMLVFLIFILEMFNTQAFSNRISLLCGIACLFILKDDILMMLAAGKWFGLLDIQKRIQSNQVGWQFFLNSDSKVIVFSTIFLFMSNLFVLFTIGISKAIIVGINSHSFTKNQVFWNFVEGKSKKGKKTLKVMVDHKEWVSEDGSIVLALQNIAFIYPLEMYLIIMTLVVILLPQSFTTFVLLFIAFPYLISLWNFKKKDTRAKLERLYFINYILLCWIILVFFYPLSLVFYPSQFSWDGLQPDFSLPLIILINKTYQDFLYMEDYSEFKAKLKANKSLLSSLINTCNTYSANENKLRENFSIFIKQSAVIECTEKISTSDTEPKNINTRLVEHLFQYDKTLLDVVYQKTGFWEKFKIEGFTWFYQSLLKLNYPEIFESLFYLYSTFKRKNRRVLAEEPDSAPLSINSFFEVGCRHIGQKHSTNRVILSKA